MNCKVNNKYLKKPQLWWFPGIYIVSTEVNFKVGRTSGICLVKIIEKLIYQRKSNNHKFPSHFKLMPFVKWGSNNPLSAAMCPRCHGYRTKGCLGCGEQTVRHLNSFRYQHSRYSE